ncbi:uncharacterized protein LOC110189349 [Drosophila serrata]|uniref:uncharacterized protein LOC110189349 n=1 Tax=Drosophila serrata TaxID=7274 RepID=UPI000A1D05A2|nr:uncharacterized protein LOC110189349 [Drosophila serrata]
MHSILILSTILSVIVTSLAYSTKFGEPFAHDLILFRRTEIRHPLDNKYWNVKVEFPCEGSINNFTISAINVYDHFVNSSGAAPSFLRGGVGASEVTINLSGQVNRGINSTIEIWGF